eukprot:TRINITY_DN554_c0_g3_i2.p2 TRINITY_DN554_c0_g3~~TRINITY_DN554_c0_g3_i2.p2  ORF type:complete len:417 (-),score=-18.04 TRINITY_DN554_c0_g3_i2:625-1719(-)
MIAKNVCSWLIMTTTIVCATRLLTEFNSSSQDNVLQSANIGEQVELIRQVIIQQLDYDDSWQLKWNTICHSYTNKRIAFQDVNFFAKLDIYRTGITLLFIWILSLGVIFAIVHRILQRSLQVYNSYDSSQQFIVSFHVVMCTVLGVQVFTHSWVMVLFLYSDPIHVLLEYSWLFLSLCVTHFVLYTVELIVRTVIRVQPFVFLHHCMFMSYLLLMFTNPSIFIMQNEHIVGWMVVFEFLLYAGNICYRFCDKNRRRLVQNVIMNGLILYVLSRIAQTVMLIQHFVCTDAPKNHIYWILVVFALLLSAIQLYTFLPYFYMYNNAGNARNVLNNNYSNNVAQMIGNVSNDNSNSIDAKGYVLHEQQ